MVVVLHWIYTFHHRNITLKLFTTLQENMGYRKISSSLCYIEK